MWRALVQTQDEKQTGKIKEGKTRKTTEQTSTIWLPMLQHLPFQSPSLVPLVSERSASRTFPFLDLDLECMRECTKGKIIEEINNG